VSRRNYAELVKQVLRVPPERAQLGTAIDTMGEPVDDEFARAYETRFEEAIESGGSIYGELSPFFNAAHERRIELLGELPIEDLTEKVVVDFGVGSWGVACIFPRIQQCGLAIGIDISYAACKESARISREGEYPYGDNWVYLTSRGDDIPLNDGSVDFFFAGECIEHVDNTDSFLEEIHRVLKPGGIFVLTTPNADAYVYRIQNERYCVGVEHVALMGHDELMAYLAPRFEVMESRGFNGSLHQPIDNLIFDAEFARMWVRMVSDPANAASLVTMCRRRDDHLPRSYRQKEIFHTDESIESFGTWNHQDLFGGMSGKLADHPGASLTFDVTGSDLLVLFWCHEWSGLAGVRIDNGPGHDVNLYSRDGGFYRAHFRDLGPGSHRVVISSSGEHDPRASGAQVIFHKAIAYGVKTA
jgi:SAM-dependent methyltransferase